jgi:hypothetical protein
MTERREFGMVHRDVWEKMVEIARREDISKGGMFDARTAAINVWYREGDRPKGQDFPIIGGEAEAAYHSGLYADFKTHFSVVLSLEVENFEHERHVEQTTELTGHPRAVAREAALRGFEEDWRWARAKFTDLKERAEADVQGKTAQRVAE